MVSPGGDNREAKPKEGLIVSGDPAYGSLQAPSGQIRSLVTNLRKTQSKAPDAKTIIADEEFILALSQTDEYQYAPEGTQPKRDIQSLLRPVNVEQTRPAAERVLVAIWEMLDGDYLAPPNATEEIIDQHYQKWLKYLSILSNSLQSAAERFSDRTLWQVLDEKVLANLLPNEERFNSLRASLAEIRQTNKGVDRSALLTVFSNLRELSYELVKGSAQNVPLAALAAGFALRGISFAVKDLPISDIREARDIGVRELLINSFGNTLATELATYEQTGSTPLFTLLEKAEVEGVAFAEALFKSFFVFTESFFNDLRREQRFGADGSIKCNDLIEAVERFGQAACIIWPDSFPDKLIARYQSLNHYQQASALRILQHGISDREDRTNFVVEQALSIYQSSIHFVHARVVEVLKNLAEPAAVYLSQDWIPARRARENANLLVVSILKEVFVEAAMQNHLSDDARVALAPYLTNQIARTDLNLDSVFTVIGVLFAPCTLINTDIIVRQKLIWSGISAFAEALSKEEVAKDIPLQAHRNFGRYIAAFGYAGVIQIFNETNNHSPWLGTNMKLAACLAIQSVSQQKTNDQEAFANWFKTNGINYFNQLLNGIKPKAQIKDDQFSDFLSLDPEPIEDSLGRSKTRSSDDQAFYQHSIHARLLKTVFGLSFISNQERSRLFSLLPSKSLRFQTLAYEVLLSNPTIESGNTKEVEDKISQTVGKFFVATEQKEPWRNVELAYGLQWLESLFKSKACSASVIFAGAIFKPYFEHLLKALDKPMSSDRQDIADPQMGATLDFIIELFPELTTKEQQVLGPKLRKMFTTWAKAYQPQNLRTDYLISPDTMMQLGKLLIKYSLEPKEILQVAKYCVARITLITESTMSAEQGLNALLPLQELAEYLQKHYEEFANLATDFVADDIRRQLSTALIRIKELSNKQFTIPDTRDFGSSRVPNIPYHYQPGQKRHIRLIAPNGQQHPLIASKPEATQGRLGYSEE